MKTAYPKAWGHITDIDLTSIYKEWVNINALIAALWISQDYSLMTELVASLLRTYSIMLKLVTN